MPENLDSTISRIPVGDATVPRAELGRPRERPTNARAGKPAVRLEKTRWGRTNSANSPCRPAAGSAALLGAELPAHH
jgi:hypothetical protein